jgi:hypothetical protein
MQLEEGVAGVQEADVNTRSVKKAPGPKGRQIGYAKVNGDEGRVPGAKTPG